MTQLDLLTVAAMPKKFDPPTIEEAIYYAAKVGLPEIEAKKFWYHHDARGWMLGRARLPMKSWQSAMVIWKLNWEEDGPPAGRASAVVRPTTQPQVNGALLVIRGKELERCLELRRQIRATYGDHQSWAKDDVLRYNKLNARIKELRAELGIVV